MVGHVGRALPGQTFAGAEDAYVRKYDPSGVELWTRQFGSISSDIAMGVAVDASGQVWVAGFTLNALPGQTSAGFHDAFVRGYDASGTELWTRQFGSSGHDFSTELSVDPSGSVIVVGYTGGALETGEANAGYNDVFVRKYDSTGAELWTHQFGTVRFDQATSVDADEHGNVFVGGWTQEALPGQTSMGFDDAFLRKYDASGAEIWTRQLGTSSHDAVTALRCERWRLVIAGFVEAALPGQTHLGAEDAFVMTLAP